MWVFCWLVFGNVLIVVGMGVFGALGMFNGCFGAVWVFVVMLVVGVVVLFVGFLVVFFVGCWVYWVVFWLVEVFVV